MRAIRILRREQRIEAVFRILERGVDDEPQQPQARCPDGDEQCLNRRDPRRQVRESAVDEICSGKAVSHRSIIRPGFT